MVNEIRVTSAIGTPEVIQLLNTVQADVVFPHLLSALNQIALMYQTTWMQFAGGAPIPGTTRVINSRGDYIRSIKTNLSGTVEKVVYSDSVANQYIEKGHGEIDLKPGLLSGKKARISKSGHPFNIVHFRHGMPNTLPSNNPMPATIYSLMQKESRKADQQRKQSMSKVAAQGKNTYGVKVPQGTQLGRRTQLYSQYTWKSGKYAGMVKMQTSTGKAKSSKYITFRMVSSRSDPRSWIVPPLEGIPIRQRVVETVKEFIPKIIEEAIKEDLSG